MNNLQVIKKIFFCLIVLFIGINVYAEEFAIDSKYAILYNLNDNQVIYNLKENDRISVASLTKIMTSIVAIENIKNLNDKVTITSDVFNDTSELAKAGFYIGEEVTYYDLLYGAMLPSGADATNALALNITGSIDKYVELMNDKASELGLTSTHFVNTTGLDANKHYSSVSDISKLLIYALKNETFKKIFTTKTYKTSDSKLTFQSTVLKNSKRYGVDSSIIKGAKTGFTDEAGLCMASISTLSDVDYLLVTCGANSKDNTPHQLLDAITIYNYFNTNYSYRSILSDNQDLITLKVKNSYTDEIKFKSDKEIKKYLNKNIDTALLKYEYDGVDVLTPKNKKDSIIVNINILYDNTVLDKYDIVLKEEIESNILDRMIMFLGLILSCILFILLIFDFIRKIFKKSNKK